jgi:hypothetical protein
VSSPTRKLKRSHRLPLSIPRCQRAVNINFKFRKQFTDGFAEVTPKDRTKELINGVEIIETIVYGHGPRFNTADGLHPLKGKHNGRCNRTSCQTPLEHEAQHQWMGGICTGGPHLYYCARCSGEFDKWDRIDNPQGPRRIERAPRLETDPQGDR